MKSDQHYSTLESKILEWRTTISRIIVILDTSQVFLIYGCSATVAIQHKNVAFDISLVKISLTNLKIRHSKREATDDGSVPFLLVLRNRYPFSLGYFRMYIRCFTMLTRLTIIFTEHVIFVQNEADCCFYNHCTCTMISSFQYKNDTL